MSDDGSCIRIPSGQTYRTYQYDEVVPVCTLYPMIIETDGDSRKYIVDENADELVLKVGADGSLSPAVDSPDKIWGIVKTYIGRDWKDYIYIIPCDRFVPTEGQPELPPPGLRKLDYQMKYYSLSGGNYAYGDIAKRLKAVFEGDRVWIQGLSFFHPEAWVSGKKDGDKYVFGGRQTMSANRYLLYATGKWESWSHVMHAVIEPVEDDIVFSFDSASRSLYQDGEDNLMCSPVESYEFSIEVLPWYGDMDFYWQILMEPIPDGPQYPQPPVIGTTERYGRGKLVTVSGSYFDTNGYMMDKNNLYFRLYVNGEPFIFTGDNSWKTSNLIESTETMPYCLLNCTGEKIDLPSSYTLEVKTDEPLENLSAELVYVQGDREYSSSSVGHASWNLNGMDDDNVYDLTGRKVSEGSMSPGIYIRGGRKFIVR